MIDFFLILDKIDLTNHWSSKCDQHNPICTEKDGYGKKDPTN